MKRWALAILTACCAVVIVTSACDNDSDDNVHENGGSPASEANGSTNNASSSGSSNPDNGDPVPAVWAYKEFESNYSLTTITEFLNGEGSYDTPVAVKAIAAHYGYHVFYRTDEQGSGGWHVLGGIDPDTDTGRIAEFANGTGAYTGWDRATSVLMAQRNDDGIAVWRKGKTTFFLTSWSLEETSGIEDARDLFNGGGGYSNPRVGAACAANPMFALTTLHNAASAGWSYKYTTTIDDVMAFLNGTGDYNATVTRAEICRGVWGGFRILYKH